jgi:hypothetical protein
LVSSGRAAQAVNLVSALACSSSQGIGTSVSRTTTYWLWVDDKSGSGGDTYIQLIYE